MKVQWDVVWSVLRTLLVAGGPVATLLIALGFPPVTVSTYLAVGLAIVGIASAAVPGLIAAFTQTDSHAVAKVASMPAPVVQEALKQVPDEAKVAIAETVPSVATVVVKDGVNGKIGELAADPNHPNIVTETKNEADAKMGTKVL